MRSPRPVRTCEEILREHEKTRSPLRARPAKRALLAAGLQRLREQQAELEQKRRQRAAEGPSPPRRGGITGALRSGSPRGGDKGADSSPSGAGQRSPYLQRQPFLLLANRTVSGERKAPGGGGGDAYSVVNTIVRRIAAAGAASAGSGMVRSPGASPGGRHASPPRPCSPIVSPSVKATWADGRGGGIPSPIASVGPPHMQQRESRQQQPVAAAVADAQARVHLAAASAAVSRGSSPIPPPRYGMAQDLVMSLPPYVIVSSSSHEQGGRREPVAAFSDDHMEDEASMPLSRESRLPPPGLLGDGLPAAVLKPRLAPWELGQQLQESLRK